MIISKYRYNWFLLFFSSLILNSCIERIDLEIPKGNEKLVIEGLITNENKPYQVKISRSLPDLNEPISESSKKMVSHAIVLIKDDLGKEVELTEIKPGIYETTDDSFVGEIGRTYSLIVELGSQKYVSTAEAMKPVPEIQNLNYEYSKENYFNENNIELSRFFLDVYIDLENYQESNSNLLFEWKNVYEYETFPQNNRGGINPEPYPCSGLIFDQTTSSLLQIGPCTCCDCWGTNYSPVEQVVQLTPNSIKRNLKVASIFVEPFEFQEKVQVEIISRSLSETGYKFWKLIEEQKNNSGSIFDVPLGKLKGNISNETNSEEEVLGFFGASAISKSSFFLLKHNVAVPIVPFDNSNITTPCTSFGAQNITNEKPSDW